MNIEDLREYCLSKKAVTEDFPFDENVLVFKIGGKIFALCNINSFSSINLKCDPEYAIELREQYIGVAPGFHMNKKHWNTVHLNQDVDAKLLMHLIDHSYTQVFGSLTKKLQAEIGN
jgi:predicted DNA-binding protein (MmcQ/YjbR family)